MRTRAAYRGPALATSPVSLVAWRSIMSTHAGNKALHLVGIVSALLAGMVACGSDKRVDQNYGTDQSKEFRPDGGLLVLDALNDAMAPVQGTVGGQGGQGTVGGQGGQGTVGGQSGQGDQGGQGGSEPITGGATGPDAGTNAAADAAFQLSTTSQRPHPLKPSLGTGDGVDLGKGTDVVLAVPSF